jgi:hypothetical protein
MSDVIEDLANACYLVMWIYLIQRYARGYRLTWVAPARYCSDDICSSCGCAVPFHRTSCEDQP